MSAEEDFESVEAFRKTYVAPTYGWDTGKHFTRTMPSSAFFCNYLPKGSPIFHFVEVQDKEVVEHPHTFAHVLGRHQVRVGQPRAVVPSEGTPGGDGEADSSSTGRPRETGCQASQPQMTVWQPVNLLGHKRIVQQFLGERHG